MISLNDALDQVHASNASREAYVTLRLAVQLLTAQQVRVIEQKLTPKPEPEEST